MARRLCITLLVLAAYIALVQYTSPIASALRCAHGGIGTDMAIAQCFIERGLPCPTDICGR